MPSCWASAAAAVVDAAAGDDGHVRSPRRCRKSLYTSLGQAGSGSGPRGCGPLSFLVHGRDDECRCRACPSLVTMSMLAVVLRAASLAVGPDVVGRLRAGSSRSATSSQQVLSELRRSFCAPPSTLSASTLQAGLPASALPSRAGRTSVTGALVLPPGRRSITMIWSAMFRMRS